MLQEQASRKNTAVTRKPIISLWDALLAKNGVMAYLPIIVVVILMVGSVLSLTMLRAGDAQTAPGGKLEATAQQPAAE